MRNGSPGASKMYESSNFLVSRDFPRSVCVCLLKGSLDVSLFSLHPCYMNGEQISSVSEKNACLSGSSLMLMM